MEFLLPLIGATDLDDWPGGVRQQFKAACPMVEEILRNVPVRSSCLMPFSSCVVCPPLRCAHTSNARRFGERSSGCVPLKHVMATLCGYCPRSKHAALFATALLDASS